jgi:hypothetical protein
MYFFGFSMYSIMFVNKGSYTSFFSDFVPFIYFHCIIALARASCMMLNKGTVIRQSCLILDLRKKPFTLSPLNVMLNVNFFFHGCPLLD